MSALVLPPKVMKPKLPQRTYVTTQTSIATQAHAKKRVVLLFFNSAYTATEETWHYKEKVKKSYSLQYTVIKQFITINIDYKEKLTMLKIGIIYTIYYLYKRTNPGGYWSYGSVKLNLAKVDISLSLKFAGNWVPAVEFVNRLTKISL